MKPYSREMVTNDQGRNRDDKNKGREIHLAFKQSFRKLDLSFNHIARLGGANNAILGKACDSQIFGITVPPNTP